MLIIFLLFIASSLYHIKPVSSRIIHVPSEYATIQAAVTSASAGDTIQVAPGVYNEHIYVNKSLTIEGENPQTTIVDGAGNGIIFDLDANNIHITGFKIRDAGNNYSAITAENDIVTTNNHRISNNIITTSQYGVYLSASDQNTIVSNTFIDNPFGGIYINNADNTNITGNIIRESAYGIKAQASLNNIIVGNTISQTSYAIYLTSASTGNTVQRNNLSGKTAGLYSSSDSTTAHHNTITDGSSGIYFANCRFGSIFYNTLINNSYGIRLYWSSFSTSTHNVNNNKIQNADWAIEITYASGNTFTGNWLQQNTYGIYMTSSSSNTLYRNNFVYNSMQAYAGLGSGNLWDYNGQGNYWSDYQGTGAYNIIPTGKDNYPLRTTWSEHDIEIQSVTPSTNEAYPGAIIDVTVIVKNRANISGLETFIVTAKYNSGIIGTQQVNNLAQGATQVLIFNWVTTGVAAGNYIIKAEASVVPDELNTDNNNFTDGTVRIKELLTGDINRDGAVNFVDLTLLVQAYGSTLGSPNWNPNADLNNDNIINVVDLSLLSKNYGKTA